MTYAQVATTIPEFGETEEIKFTIRGEEFSCPPELPVFILVDFALNYDQVSAEQFSEKTKDMLAAMFTMVLTEESGERFVAHLSDRTRPIGIKSMQRSIEYILEKYGMRPTPPSDGSSTSGAIPESGPNSTANAPDPESTYAELALAGS